MQLPSWFSVTPRTMSTSLQNEIFTDDVVKFNNIAHGQFDYTYRGLFSSAFKKVTTTRREDHFQAHPHLKNVLTIEPFTPPGFVNKIFCRIDENSVYKTPMGFMKTSILDKKQNRSKVRSIIVKLQGVIAGSYQ